MPPQQHLGAATTSSSRAPEVLLLLLTGAVGLGGVIAFARGEQRLGYALSATSTLATTALAMARLLGD